MWGCSRTGAGVIFALAVSACGSDEKSTRAAATGGSAGTDGGAGSGGSGGSAGEPAAPTFEKFELTSEFHSEGASYGDFDGDGIGDVVAGPFVYRGPDFKATIQIYPPVFFDRIGYSDNFFAFPRDLDGNGTLDVLFVNFPGKDAYWYENPKQVGAAWVRHSVLDEVSTESPRFTDLTGDGVPELVCANGGKLGWAEPGADPAQPWPFHPASEFKDYKPFTHGLGVGDIDGDGRKEILEAPGFWTPPASLIGDPVWSFEAHQFGGGGADMFATDVDGDGDADVIASLAAHGYGISWFEQVKGASGREFVEHPIAAKDPANPGDLEVIHEPHALALADVNGDGLLDIVTGERFWGHYDGWPSELASPAKLYWFELRRDAGGTRYIPHLIDDASGVGTQVVAGDVNADGRIDVVLSNKKGAFVFLQRAP